MHGHVRTITGDEPISMIKVSTYRPGLTLIDHAFTNDGSLVTEVVTDDAVPLDRRLLPVGQFADTARGIDVLAANLLASAVEGPEYAGALHGAGRRLMGRT
ncbi:hypothetical protein [Streptomyces coeruleofuscus]|uniref:Uncharacterized protein n=1 Tax=Streptomyces coeruleofuscus TaxID=66879 RepID=A0ABN3J9H9_9ACTN